MKHRVRILADAEEDIYEIFHYVAAEDSREKAWNRLDRLEDKCLSLATFPRRGRIVPELKTLGVSRYREIHFKPYRILYTVEEREVYVYAILDGRRELTDLLQRRLSR